MRLLAGALVLAVCTCAPITADKVALIGHLGGNPPILRLTSQPSHRRHPWRPHYGAWLSLHLPF